ncbi:MAG: nucleotidyl transferase AbiEii/AbiGii toxin family protein [Paludibacteraceae bacterium]|jgi:predicted nucleotidyltransferase component of viral defense system|nr:nucleotidyl transferase AbiEii/AbiGii toxin family protein [Paludibacteraceae bacterium]
MLSVQTVKPDTLELLKAIAALPEAKETRLVGGTALALQYGHRQSVDLDFFGRLPDDKDEIIEAVGKLGEYRIINRTKMILQMVVNGVKVDFVDYSRYPWIDKPIFGDGFVLASAKDIAAMKINAVMGRGTRKDFIDLYELLRHYSIENIMDFYRQKYPEFSEYRALLSMTYFDDAELQDMPLMFTDTPWDTMKSAIIDAVKLYQN